MPGYAGLIGDKVFEVDDLTFRYGRKTVLSGVTLTLTHGASVLLGRNGAGKTTLIRILAGAARPHAGQVRLDGRPAGGHTRSERRTLRGIGWLPQSFGFPPRMTTAQFITYAAWLKEVPRTRVAGRVADVLALVDLEKQAGTALGALSGGQVRRAGLAAALAADPEVLILDEPTAGLDPEQRDGFHTLIRRVRAEKTVLVATHLLEDAEAIADRVIVIDGGAIVWTGTAADLSGSAGADHSLTGLRRGFQAVIGNRS